jgi:hypothetical protein
MADYSAQRVLLPAAVTKMPFHSLCLSQITRNIAYFSLLEKNNNVVFVIKKASYLFALPPGGCLERKVSTGGK